MKPPKHISSFFKKNNLILPFFIAASILVVGFFVRSSDFIYADPLFLPDQARDLILVKEMVETRTPPMIGARAMSGGYIFHGPLWIWFLGIPFYMFSGDPFLISYTYVLISLLIIATSFIVAYKLYGLRTASFVGLFITSSHMLSNNVAVTTNAHIMPLVFVFYLFFLIKYLRGDKKSFFITVFFAGLGVQFQGIFSVPLLFFIILVSIFTDKYIFHIKRILLSLACFMLPLSTFLVFDIRHNFLIGRGLFRLLTDEKGLGAISGYEQYSNLGFRIVDRLNGLVSTPYLIMSDRSQFLYFILGLVLIIATTLILKKKSRYKKEFLVMLSLPLFIYTVFVYFAYPVWEHYIFSIPVVIAFIFAVAIERVWTLPVGKALTFLVVVIISSSLINKINLEYFSDRQKFTSDGSYTNQLNVVDYIFKDSASNEFGYFVYSPQVFTYGMDYLMWWRGSSSGYMPESSKKEIFYLIMYPHLSGDEGAYDYWTKNVIRTEADVLFRREFDGGIIVEKRLSKTDEEDVDPNYYLNVR